MENSSLDESERNSMAITLNVHTKSHTVRGRHTGPDYMANFSPGLNFSPARGAEILLRLHNEFQPGLKY